MAVTNIHLAKKLSGQPLRLNEIQRGSVANFPSGAGGTVACICTECTDTHAIFESKSKDWPLKWKVDLCAKDFTLREFNELSDALDAYGSNMMPTDAQRAIVARAASLGYAASMSYTQAHWLEKGIEVKRHLEVLLDRASQSESVLDSMILKCCSADDAYELWDQIDSLPHKEKLSALKNTLNFEDVSK